MCIELSYIVNCEFNLSECYLIDDINVFNLLDVIMFWFTFCSNEIFFLKEYFGLWFIK